ncbi:MAG TPA: TlpA disulfide reductase family protein [Balneolales bacterium]|nr:TlpA disulfide reductase family protein [Balneolales bacterium]
MNGNWIQYIIQYGQIAAILLALTSFVALFFIGRGNKYFLPRGFWGWTGALLSVLVLWGSVFTFLIIQYPLSPLKSAYEHSGKKVPEFSFQLVTDKSTHNISEYKGHVILLNFWATWCGPCRKEMPALDLLQKNYQKDGLIILTISDEERPILLNYFQQHPMSVVKGYIKRNSWSKGPFKDIQEIRPVSYIINRKGKIEEGLPGGHTYNELQSKLLRFLN